MYYVYIRKLRSYSRNSQHFMEPEGSLPCPQEPSTGPYPEPDQSNPSHPLSLRSILISSTHLRLGLPSGLFLASSGCGWRRRPPGIEGSCEYIE
jgi:hypothetical protein